MGGLAVSEHPTSFSGLFSKETPTAGEMKAALAEAYRCGYMAGRTEENERCAKLCAKSDRYRGEYFAALIRRSEEQ